MRTLHLALLSVVHVASLEGPIMGQLVGQASGPVLLPQDKGDESAACLDGSPYGFYFFPSRTGSQKWTVSIEGGGWCFDERQCFRRTSIEHLGSSKQLPSAFNECRCMNVGEDGNPVNDCNCVMMPYCDGASFSGYRKEPWVNPMNSSELVYFRGIKNFDATMDYLFEAGLGKATEFVLTGGSAGGLSTFLHIDRIAERLPGCKVQGVPIGGYFLDQDPFRGLHHALSTPSISNSYGKEDRYTELMKGVFTMQNITFGERGLAADCGKAYPASPHLCFLSPHMLKFIKTPIFMFNSRFDQWQIHNVLRVEVSHATDIERTAILKYGDDFLERLDELRSDPKNGAAITTCICHACRWGALEVEGRLSYQHYADWSAGKTHGADAIHVDKRGPNADGSFNSAMWCANFPSGEQGLENTLARLRQCKQAALRKSRDRAADSAVASDGTRASPAMLARVRPSSSDLQAELSALQCDLDLLQSVSEVML